jgi:hypothetical protein
LKQLFSSLVLLITAIGCINTASAQNCDGVRYVAPTFPAYDSSTVIYSTDSMTMDIYQPDGDTITNRKVVLMVHGGNFYQGSSVDPFIYHICQYYVQRGYVTASINYPLITPTQILQNVLIDSETAYPIIAQCIIDGKAAVRYLKKNAASLRIDSSWIVIGGESSGALIADHVAYLKSTAGVSPLLDSAFNAIGGIEGNSGNVGYSSKVKAILNYGGGMLDLNMLTALDNEPIYTAQGDSDHNIPFSCGSLFDGYTNYTACGGGAMQPILTTLGIRNQLLMFDSLDYEPWSDSTMAQTGDTNHIALYQVDSQSITFLYQIDCPTFTGIRDISTAHVNLFPNPASTLVYIETDAAMESVELIDRLGRLVKTLPATGEKTQIDLSGLTSGIYLAKINLKAGQNNITRSFVVE